MIKTLHAVFDGRVLRPEEPADLEVNKHYLLSIEPVEKTKEVEDIKNDSAYNISEIAVKTGVHDLASEHDHYLYGKPKRGVEDV